MGLENDGASGEGIEAKEKIARLGERGHGSSESEGGRRTIPAKVEWTDPQR